MIVRELNAVKFGLKVKKREIEFYICIGILAILFTTVFSGTISAKVFERAHYIDIAVVAEGWDGREKNESKIIDPYYLADEGTISNTKEGKLEYSSYGLEQLENTVVLNEGFSVEEEDGIRALVPEYEGAYIVFKLPVYPTTCIGLQIDPETGGFGIYKNGEWIRSFGYYERGSETNYFMFSTNELIYIYVWYVFYYIMIWGVLYISGVIFCEIISLLRRYRSEKGVMPPYVKLWNAMIIGVFHFGYTCFTYSRNVERFMVGEGADAFYYMYPNYLDEAGGLSPGAYIGTTYPMRGYIPHAFAIVNNTIADFMNIDVMYIHFLLFAVLIGVSLGFIIPQMAECVLEKKCARVVPVIMYFLFMLFWRSHFFYYLTDVPAAILALDSIAYLVQGLKDKSYKNFIFAGVFMGGAIGYRSAYSYVAYTALLICIIVIFKKDKEGIKKKIRKNLFYIICWGIGAVMILWPQGIINSKRGHAGIFPYDGGWAYSAEDGNTASLMETSFSGGLHAYQFMHVDGADKQTLNIDTPLYASKSLYLVKDMILMIFAQPKEFFSGYVKKLFWALSADYEAAYMSAPFPEKYSSEMIGFLSILNYLLLWNVLSHIFRGGFFDKTKEKCINLLLVGALISNVFPQGLLHIERRYFMFFYMIVYFYNAYSVFEVEDYKKIANIRYVIGACVFSICCYSIKATLQLNFL